MWRFSGGCDQKRHKLNKIFSCARASHSPQKCDKCNASHFLSPKKVTNVTSLSQMWDGRNLGRNSAQTDPHSESFRDIQSHLESFRIIQNDSETFRVIQSNSGWFRVIQSHSKSFRVIQSESEWFKVIQNDLDLFRDIQRHSEWFRVFQSHSEWFKVIQSDPIPRSVYAEFPYAPILHCIYAWAFNVHVYRRVYVYVNVQIYWKCRRSHTPLRLGIECVLIERNPPPGGGFLFTMFSDQEPCVRDFTTRCDRLHLVMKSLTHGSWSGNIVNRKTPRGGWFLSINMYMYVCICTYTYLRGHI